MLHWKLLKLLKPMKKQLFTFLVAGTFALYSCENKQTENTTTTTEDTTASEVSETGQAQSFVIDTANSIIKWTGKKVAGSHNGTIKIQSGQLQTQGKTITDGEVVINMNSIQNEDLKDKESNQKLVGHLRSDDFFSVEKNPTATFDITRIDAGEKEDDAIITGNLTIKGKSEEISIPVKTTFSDDKIKAKGTTTIDRTKWDIRYGSKKFFDKIGDKAIYDEVELEFEVEATKS